MHFHNQPVVTVILFCLCAGLASLKDSLDGQQRNSDTWSKASLEEVLHCLQDLIEFFAQPDSNSEWLRVQHLQTVSL